MLGLAFVLCYPLGMPGYDVPFIPFLSLIPLFALSASAESPRAAARCGFAAGTAANLLVYYWIAWTVAVPGNLGWFLGAACALAVSAFVAGFIAAFCALGNCCLRRSGPGTVWLFPVFWTAIEMGRIHLFTGFPWMLLGYSLADSPVLRQSADIAGTLGLGFLIVAVNVALYRGMTALGNRNVRAAILPGILAAAILASMAGYGRYRLGEPQAAGGRPLRVGIAQGGIDQNRKWDPSLQEETIRIYHELTVEAVAGGARVVVWPETAAPFFYGWESALTAMVDNVAIRTGTPIVFGAPWFNPEDGGKYFNSVFHLDGRGLPVGRYDKRHLVPFGEYVPLRRLLPFISKLTAGEEDFSYGKSPSLFGIDNTRAAASVCYEAVFPEIIRESVQAGAGWLINVTNDAWFGDTVAPYQHLAMARMRAVELRRPMVRAANSGISAVIDPKGRIVRSLGLFRKGTVVAEIVPETGMTPFAKTGELFGYSCIIIGFLTFLFALKGTHGHRITGGADNRP
jgi:apolipoprotein N-acyltransferase